MHSATLIAAIVSLALCVGCGRDDWVDVSVSMWHSCGLTDDGSLECWGCEPTWDDIDALDLVDFGQCDAPGGTYASVSAGWENTCAVTTEGTIECWGLCSNDTCEVSDGNFVATAAGMYNSYGLTEAGEILCWGDNSLAPATCPTPRSPRSRPARSMLAGSPQAGT